MVYHSKNIVVENIIFPFTKRVLLAHFFVIMSQLLSRFTFQYSKMRILKNYCRNFLSFLGSLLSSHCLSIWPCQIV
uniref:Ovule protein n=1 Tax=Parascaris equorum TaxID=6256 RepID=A0A914REX3_PAREQ